MRDIRDDLKARRAAVLGRYADAMHDFEVEQDRFNKERRKAIETFEAERATLDDMIALEERRHAAQTDTIALPQPTSTLGNFIVEAVQVAGPIDKDRLRAQAAEAGFVEGGRAFNMTLQNVATAGRIKKLPDGRFADGRSTANLFGMGGSTEEAPMTHQ